MISLHIGLLCRGIPVYSRCIPFFHVVVYTIFPVLTWVSIAILYSTATTACIYTVCSILAWPARRQLFENMPVSLYSLYKDTTIGVNVFKAQMN